MSEMGYSWRDFVPFFGLNSYDKRTKDIKDYRITDKIGNLAVYHVLELYALFGVVAISVNYKELSDLVIKLFY